MEKRSRLFKSILHVVFHLNLLRAYSEGSLQDQYIGCYYDSSSQSNWIIGLLNSSQVTVESCILTCKESNSTYAILQGERSCLCGDVINASVPSYACQTPCSGDDAEMCGGTSQQMVLSVIYTVCPVGHFGVGCDHVCHCKQYIPCHRISGVCPNGCESSWTGGNCSKEVNVSGRYIGCYRDERADRAMIDFGPHREKNTIEYCSAICATNDYTYLGLQYDYQCYCGESYNKHGTAANCDMQCSGNRSQICGGSFANSVYSVCPTGTYGKDCVAPCNCLNSRICSNRTGSCNASCKPGWSGESCNERNCADQRGDCSANETCVAAIPVLPSASRCHCSRGYQRTWLWDNCTDIDECTRGPCDNQTTTCSNTVGSFLCNCRKGYTSANKTFCADINECTTLQGICNSTQKICENTIGSYKCNCIPGYVTDGNDTCIVGMAPPENGKVGTIVGAVVGSILGLALIVVIVLLMLYLYRRRCLGKLDNHIQEFDELPSSSQENLLRDQTASLYAKDRNVYEEIGPVTGNALNTVKNKLSEPDSLKLEFDNVPLKARDFCALGTRDEVKKKNRFINIIPYESNRVVLSRTTDEDTSQYINASYVQSYDNKAKFIAAQGPREDTLEDFWRMIIENRVHLIVMITNIVENRKNKCEKYWPELGHPVVYGKMTVTLRSEDSWPDYIVRCIQCSKNSKTVELTQLHYLSWPDHGVPNDIKGFLTFRRIVRQRMKPDNYTLVHCSAGAGRTGTFIAIDYLLEQEKVESDVRLLDCLKKLRDQRSHMVQNLAQYVFVHNALLLAFEIGDTAIPSAQFLSKYTQFQGKDADSGKSFLEKQFQFLEQVLTMDPEETAKFRVLSNVVAHNQMTDMQAVYVQSWKMKDAYISLQPADPFTHIWELRQELGCAVMIFLDPTEGSGPSLFPTKENPITLKDCTLLLESKTMEDYGSRSIISELRQNEETTYANVSSSEIYQNTGPSSANAQITVLCVNEFLGESPEDANRLLTLYSVVSSLWSKKKDVPVMIVSSDCSLTGFCLAAFNAFEMIEQEQMIDIYQIVLDIRKSKRELFNSMLSYIDLHNVIEKFILMSAVKNSSN